MEDDDSKTLQIRKSQIGVELPANEPTSLDHDSVTLAAPLHTPSEPSLSGARPIVQAQHSNMKRQFGRYELLLELGLPGLGEAGGDHDGGGDALVADLRDRVGDELGRDREHRHVDAVREV